MAAKREQTFWKVVWDVAKPLEHRFGLKAICSAGVVLLNRSTPEERESLIEQLKSQEKELHQQEKLAQKEAGIALIADAAVQAGRLRQKHRRKTGE